MFKTLTARAVVPVALAITGFVVVCCLLLYATVKEDLTRGAFEQERSLAATVVKSARYTMLNADREGLRNIVRNVGEGRGVEHVRITNTRGEIAFSSRKGEEGERIPAREGTASSSLPGGRRLTNEHGTEVLAITVPIFNEAACYTAPCHVHNATQKELGTLDIGISTEHLTRSLSLMRTRMLLFCLMVLFLTIGGVAAILLRNLFAPLRLLTEYSDHAAAGAVGEPFRNNCSEINRLAKNINTLARELRNAQDELAALRGDTTRSAAKRPEANGVR